MKSKINFQQKETEFKGSYKHQIFRTLMMAYAPFLSKILFLFVIGFIGRLALLFNTNLIGYWVDTFCKNQQDCKPPPAWFISWTSNDYISVLLVLSCIGFILTLLFRMGFSRTSALAISRIYDEVTFRTSRYPMSFFDTTPAGRIITRFSSDYGNIFRLFGGPLAEFIALVFDLIVMVFLITIASPYYLILVGIIIGCNYWVFKHHQDGIRKERRDLSVSRTPSIAHYAETAIGASTIRTYLRQSSFLKRFLHLNDLFLDQRLKTFKKLTFFSFQISGLTSILLFITGMSSYYLLQNNLVSVGAIGVAFTFIMLSGSTVQTFFEWLAQLDEALVGTERLDHYLHLPIEIGERLPAHAKFQTPHWTATEPPLQPFEKPANFSKSPCPIRIENLSFRYREDLPWVLKNINLEIKASERIGIIGKTGSGKSSLIQTLFYLYPLTKGQITINGWLPYLNSHQPPTPQHINLTDYRKLITLIPQDPILFRGSLRNNLDLTGTISSEQLMISLERVGLSDWYKNLSLGLEHKIEERGKNLSQGERQLLCLARSLLKDSPVVIMDEATASVDPQSEQIMVQATQNFFAGRTQLIIAHRLTTLENCHRIVWLQHGEIHSIGTPDEVLPRFIQIHKNEVLADH